MSAPDRRPNLQPALAGPASWRVTARCLSAWQPNPGRRSTYRRGKSVQITGTTSESPANDTTIGLHSEYITHWLDYETFHPLKPGERASARHPFNADGTNRIPFIEDNKTWLYRESRTILQYPYFDVKDRHCDSHPQRHCYRRNSQLFAVLGLSPRAAYSKATYVWNVATDKNLVDVSATAKHYAPGSRGSLHNAIASTGVADVLVRLTYAKKSDWPILEPLLKPATLPPQPITVPTSKQQ